MPLTSLEYLKSRTSMPETDLLAPLETSAQAENWSASARKAIHEDYWGQTILEHVSQELANEDDFMRLWAKIQYHEFLFGSRKGRKFVRRQGLWPRSLLGRPRVTKTEDLAAIPYFPFLYDGKVEAISLRVMTYLRQHLYRNLMAPLVRPDTALFDLGSGWGRHAIMFASLFPGLPVHAGELSRAGQQVTEILAARLALPVTAFAFNYLDWQDMVARVRNCAESRVIVFSSHSIEQVTFVDKAMWTALLDSGKDIHFVHIEPVGWQIEANSASKFSRPPKRRRGAGGGYNKNLIAVIDSLQADGRIRDLNVVPDYISFSNLKNSGTLIRFSGAA